MQLNYGESGVEVRHSNELGWDAMDGTCLTRRHGILSKRAGPNEQRTCKRANVSSHAGSSILPNYPSLSNLAKKHLISKRIHWVPSGGLKLGFPVTHQHRVNSLCPLLESNRGLVPQALVSEHQSEGATHMMKSGLCKAKIN